jgi:hypothetical protein
MLGTQLKGGLSRLNRFGTKVTSWFRGLGEHVDLVGLGIVLAFCSSFGLLVFVLKKLEALDASKEQCWRPRVRVGPVRFSPLEQSIRELRYWIARQGSPFARIGSLQEWLRRQDHSSSLPKASPLRRLQEFQESAWLNSDI